MTSTDQAVAHAEFEIRFGMPVPRIIHLGPLDISVQLLPSGKLFLDPRTLLVTQDEFAEFLRVVGGTNAARVTR